MAGVQAEDTGVYQCLRNAMDGTQAQAAAELRLGGKKKLQNKALLSATRCSKL